VSDSATSGSVAPAVAGAVRTEIRVPEA
jgi:hypothetical protein